MSKRTVIIGLAVVLAASGLTALAQTPGAGTAAGQAQRAAGQARRAAAAPGLGIGDLLGARPGLVAKALNLTDAQRTQLKTILQGTQESVKPIRQQMQPLHQQLQQAIKDNNVAGIQAATSAIAPLQAQMMVLRANSSAQFLQILTPEQKARLAQARNRANRLTIRQRQGGKLGQAQAAKRPKLKQ